ncbi:MAG: WbqC family protein [Flavobacteriales bacterium]|nr:WbqC family protein [Flavobacteriales bacterium]
MKLAVMQPYLFPYIGYFQLINSVDKIIMYDDVNYIKNGWIDRNRILVNSNPIYFKVPLKDTSSFKKICETEINYAIYSKWKDKLYKTIELSYKKAPNYKNVFELITETFEKKYMNVGQLATQSINNTSKYLGIKTKIEITSTIYKNESLQRTERLINFCKIEGAKTYINLVSGKELYDKNNFNIRQIELNFISPMLNEYKQLKNTFIPGLSIIDVMMFNSKEEITYMLTQYKLIK